MAYTSREARNLTIGEIGRMRPEQLRDLKALPTVSVDLQAHQKKAFNDRAENLGISERV
ncbi:hypothetical protein [Ktedonospora formicarum]|uniref:Uncharacterized protein n=1 Tax=Ktedonospora formicarum TaxID=2778364 RepID=A0A8J3MTP9_9CHLR|nr:hypothetical protein [Ktedonospora formicarum]GHO45823.1 hypothetical protein KSX_39860 [Ktedonospora formicarum]